jgi:hypothetical protein
MEVEVSSYTGKLVNLLKYHRFLGLGTGAADDTDTAKKLG